MGHAPPHSSHPEPTRTVEKLGLREFSVPDAFRPIDARCLSCIRPGIAILGNPPQHHTRSASILSTLPLLPRAELPSAALLLRGTKCGNPRSRAAPPRGGYLRARGLRHARRHANDRGAHRYSRARGREHPTYAGPDERFGRPVTDPCVVRWERTKVGLTHGQR